MDYDIAKISPSMSRERLQGSHETAIIKLAKKQMEQNSEMLSEIMEAAPTNPSASKIDVKL